MECSYDRRDQPQDDPADVSYRALLTILTFGGWRSVQGSPPPNPAKRDFHLYPLRYVQAGEAQQSLKALVGPDVELLADPSLNRILVRGSPQVQQLVKSTLETLDQPKTPQTATQATAPVLACTR